MGGRFAWMLVAVVALLVAAPAADARAFHGVPSPSPAPRIVFGACPAVAEARGCYLTPCLSPWCSRSDALYLADRDPFVRQHELGHAFSYRHLSDGERARIARAMGLRRWDEEAGADAYANCRLWGPMSGRGGTVTVAGGWSWSSPRQSRRVCALFKRAFQGGKLERPI